MQLEFATVNWPVPALIGLGLLAALLGYLAGYLDSNFRTAKKITAAEAQAQTKIREAEKKMALAESGAAAGVQKDDPGLLRFKKENAHYSLEMDGKNVNKPLSSDEKKRLIELITLFRPWLDSIPAQPASKPAAPLQTPPGPVSVQQAAPRPLSPILTMAAKAEAEKNIRAMSIVNQIDTVLQGRLFGGPLEKAGIRLQESPEGGVEVIVGSDKFATVDDVTDPVIKKEIRAAIAEWEEKYVPGA